LTIRNSNLRLPGLGSKDCGLEESSNPNARNPKP